ncbi:MAG TPA: hypothetical protein VMJ32_07315 [Pirellulales bacterium]|nr:hypothetical protein [Pirellulales bacterium]
MQFHRDENLPPETARILGQLQPEPLEINRDELFFQTGLAMGTRRHASPHIWPAVAAALLLVSIGLSMVVVRQHGAILSLQTGATGFASAGPSADAESNSRFAASDPRFPSQQQRDWLRLASAAPLPPGRLTAAGWEALPPDSTDAARAATVRERNANPPTGDSPDSTNPDSTPHRPATYLELMRLQREG